MIRSFAPLLRAALAHHAGALSSLGSVPAVMLNASARESASASSPLVHMRGLFMVRVRQHRGMPAPEFAACWLADSFLHLPCIQSGTSLAAPTQSSEADSVHVDFKKVPTFDGVQMHGGLKASGRRFAAKRFCTLL